MLRLLRLTCKGYVAAISRAIDGELPPLERALLGLHLACCPPCRRCRDQFRFLRRATARLAADLDGSAPIPGPDLPREAGESIRRALEAECSHRGETPRDDSPSGRRDFGD